MERPTTQTADARIWVLATVPPPVTGMTLVTEQVVQRLKLATTIRFLNWSPGTTRRGWRTRCKRIARVLSSLAKLMLHGPVRNKRLYTVANSRSGLYMTALLVFIARRLGYFVYLHHHVYSYIDRYDWRMAWITRCMGQHGMHVVHCNKMASDFGNRYPSGSQFCFVYPSVVSQPIDRPRTSLKQPFRLGMLSNLSFSKGLDLAIDTLVELRDRGRNVSLCLGGPLWTKEARRLVERTLKRYPESLQYVGPVYGEAKAKFFSDIDAFLFPTRYVNESWGIVLNEALADGIPVITCERGCTATVIGPRAGLIVKQPARYVEKAVAQVESWMNNEEIYLAASQAAIEQAEFLNREGERTLSVFVEQVITDIDLPEPICLAS